MDSQMGHYAMGKGLMGFGAAENEPTEVGPNRAERRLLAKKLKARQRRGQRAYDRAQRNQS